MNWPFFFPLFFLPPPFPPPPPRRHLHHGYVYDFTSAVASSSHDLQYAEFWRLLDHGLVVTSMEEGELAALPPRCAPRPKRGRWCREETAVPAGGFPLGGAAWLRGCPESGRYVNAARIG